PGCPSGIHGTVHPEVGGSNPPPATPSKHSIIYSRVFLNKTTILLIPSTTLKDPNTHVLNAMNSCSEDECL
ncbi:MAG: hypothetical protein QXL41_03220, partial [Desulfurococcaceae archaeon]